MVSATLKTLNIKIAYYGICHDYGVNENESWLNGDRFYTPPYTFFHHGGKAMQRCPPESLRQGIITQYEDFKRKDIER